MKEEFTVTNHILWGLAMARIASGKTDDLGVALQQAAIDIVQLKEDAKQGLPFKDEIDGNKISGRIVYVSALFATQGATVTIAVD